MRLLTGLVLATLVVATGCGSGDDGPEPTTLQVTPDPITLAQSQATQLQVAVLDQDDQLLSGIPVTFSSSNADIAAVTNTGQVTGGRAGVANVTVRAERLSRDIEVTVTAVSNEIVLSPTPAAVAQNATLQMSATVFDITGQPVANAPIVWQSSNNDLAIVSSTGLVDPVGRAGQVNISARLGTLVGTATVAITQVPGSLSLAPSLGRMGKGAVLQMRAQVQDMTGAAITGLPLSWTSSNPSLATVTAEGRVNGQGATGRVTITVRTGSLSATSFVDLVDVGSPVGVLDGTSAIDGLAYGIAIAGSGRIMVTGTNISSATLANRTFSTLVPSGSFVYAPAIAANEQRVWVSGLPGGIAELDAVTGAVLGAVDGTGSANYFQLQFSPDGTRLYAAGSGAFTVIDPATRTVVRSDYLNNSGLSMAISPDGAKVLVGGYGDLVEVDPATGTARTVTSAGHTNFALSPDGGTAYLVAEGSPQVVPVNVATGSAWTPMPLPCSPWGIGVSPDGMRLVVTCSASIVFMEAASGDILQEFTGLGGPRRMAFSADGSIVAVTDLALGVHFIR